MPPAASRENNGRVTVAVLGAKVDRLTQDFAQFQEEFREFMRWHEERLDCIEATQQGHEEKFTSHQKEIDHVRSKSNAWDWGNSIGAILAAIIGYLK
jgi:hypothetical protein